jgi:hypothetical protein
MNRFLVFLLLLVIAACSSHSAHNSYTESSLDTESVTNITGKKIADATYMPTGFYFLVPESKGIDKRVEKSETVYTIASSPFASVKNISKVKLETTHLKDRDDAELCLTFDDQGTRDLEEGTGNPMHSKIAVVVANRLLYVVENTSKIKTGIMCISLIGYSEQDMKTMRRSVENKR